jgi:3-hydroxymyristoyl/3-hydroxydecanoyl-(acyl carrier protein) dehydratase
MSNSLEKGAFGKEWREQFTVPTQHPCYADHFPSQAVVPGAVLLEWLHECLQQRHADVQLKCIVSFKFLQPVSPGDVLTLHFRLAHDKASVQIECLRVTSDTESVVAKGKWLLGMSLGAAS